MSSNKFKRLTCSLHLRQITSRDHRRRLIIDAYFEASGTPVDKLDGPLRLDGGNRSVDILGDNVSSVQHTTRHVFAVSWVAFDHLIGWLEDSVCNLGHGQLFVVGLLRRYDRGIGGQRKVYTRVWHQISLKLSQVDV